MTVFEIVALRMLIAHVGKIYLCLIKY